MIVPPTITFVGEYEPFYWETLEYVDRLKVEGVDVAFKTYEKCNHGPDLTILKSSLGQDAITFSYDNYVAFYDKYILEIAPS